MSYMTRLKKGKLPTLKDIASETGFSVTAVSHALKDMPDISPATRKVIRDCADRLGYIANASATSLRTGRTNTVAIILGDLSNPYFSFIAKELERIFEQKGYSAFFMHSNEQLDIERRSIIAACSRNVDGIIICPTQTPYTCDNINYIRNLHTPCVIIGRYFDDIDMNYVLSDDHMAGRLAAQHLTERGHRKILYINTPIYNSSSRQRSEGFLEGCGGCGDMDITEVEFDDFGQYFIREKEKIAANAYTAIVAYNDIIGWDVMSRLRTLEMSIPNDISLISFDNIHSLLPLPFSLTSISSSKTEMTTKAADLLLRSMKDPSTPPSRITLEVSLHDRGSVKPL